MSRTSFSCTIDERAWAKVPIISFLQRLANRSSNRMSHKLEHHLPYYRKQFVYELFQEDYPQLYTDHPYPTKAYFLNIWQKFCFAIKVQNVQRFSRRAICEKIETAIRVAIDSRKCTKDLKRAKSNYTLLVVNEYLAYNKKNDIIKLYPDEFCSVVVEGASKSAFGHP